MSELHASILRPTQSKRPGCHAMVDASISRPPECKCLPSGRLRASCHNWRMGAHRIVVFIKYGAVFLARRRVRDTPTAPGSIGVLETHDENGLAVWTLRIGKEEIPGRWIIVDREFKPAQ